VALYLNTAGQTSSAIAVCSRCAMKVPYSKLVADGDKPGLRVCPECSDNMDPWRLPARMSENITLRFPRPDEPLV
jgi:hypothetical protein